MLRYASLDELSLRNVWLAIGAFDGVHRGHKSILELLVNQSHSHGAQAVVLTFHPHPAVVLRGRTDPFYLTSPEERAALMEAIGVDEVIVHPFNAEIAALSAREFVQQLHDHLDLRRLVVGLDFALGHNREGDIHLLRTLGEELNFSVTTLPQLNIGGETISSSLIRNFLRAGQVRQAANALGRPYSLVGLVVPGDRRGRTIGIPTANLKIPADRLTPKSGVYACLAGLDDRNIKAVTNIGVRPTFSDPQAAAPTVETHLLDFSGDLYGRTIDLKLIQRLRDEQRFPSVDALIEQIQTDIETAREILS